MKLVKRCLCLLGLAMLAFAAGSGCKSTEPENVSSRPWNSPRGYDSAMPGMMPGSQQYHR